MLRTVVRRLLVVMAAFALCLGATTAGGGMAMAGTTAVMSPPAAHDGAGQPCRHCPPHGGASMVACATLACAGAVADRPLSWAPFVPMATSVDYATEAAVDPGAASVAPDPFPPKPTVHS